MAHPQSFRSHVFSTLVKRTQWYGTVTNVAERVHGVSKTPLGTEVVHPLAPTGVVVCFKFFGSSCWESYRPHQSSPQWLRTDFHSFHRQSRLLT